MWRSIECSNWWTHQESSSAVSEAKIRETPGIAKTEREIYAGEDKLDRVCPVATLHKCIRWRWLCGRWWQLCRTFLSHFATKIWFRWTYQLVGPCAWLWMPPKPKNDWFFIFSPTGWSGPIRLAEKFIFDCFDHPKNNLIGSCDELIRFHGIFATRAINKSWVIIRSGAKVSLIIFRRFL